jgi:putative ABC transport system permease protein
VTLLDERPSTEPLARPPVRTSWSPTASWRLAARLARREVRRRPGRTLLVTLLVAVPILAMTIGAILVRSNTDDARFTRNYGTADLVVADYGGYDDDGQRRDPVDISALGEGRSPDGTTSTQIVTVYTFVTTDDGRQVNVEAKRFDPSSPITAGTIEVTSGRLPVAADEVLLAPSVADDLDAAVGDVLALERPDRPLTVVGLGRRSSDHRSALMLFGELSVDEVRSATIETLVDLPAGTDPLELVAATMRGGRLSAEQLDQLSVQTRTHGWYTTGRPDGLLDPTSEQLAWGWVIGVLTLTATGIIIAAAFATSARRQLATVGQLSANGAPPRLVRRTLSLQGTWSGAAGSVVGIVVGVGAFYLARPLIERLAARSWNETIVRPSDLVILVATGTAAATIAALLPARSLAATSVLSALAGRRPIRPVKPRTVAIGAACFVAGLFLLAVATVGGSGSSGGGQNLFALVAVIGGLGILAGMCLASPLAVTASTTVAARLGASWRLSGRSLARTRWRSAAVVTAIAVAGAFATAAATVATSIDDPYPEETSDIARNEVLLVTDDGTSVTAIAPGVIAEVRDVLGPSSETLHNGIDLPLPGTDQLSTAWETSEQLVFTATDVTVVDDEFLDAMGLSDNDRNRLVEVGAMSLFSYAAMNDPTGAPEPATATVRLMGAERDIDLESAVVRDGLTSRNGATALLVTREGAEQAGLDVIATGIRFTTDDDLSQTQRRALDDVRFDGAQYPDAWIVGDEPAGYTDDVTGRIGFWINYQWVQTAPPGTLIQAGIVAATLLLVMIVVGIGLSLAAAESRDERNTLIAVGASPSSLRRRSATTATLLALTGGVMAVPSGLLPPLVIDRAQPYPTGFDIPWLSITAIVVVIPLAVGAVALAGSTIAHRLRPPQVMRAFAD